MLQFNFIVLAQNIGSQILDYKKSIEFENSNLLENLKQKKSHKWLSFQSSVCYDF